MRNIYNLFQYSVFAFLLLWGSLAHGQVALPAEITEANCKAKLLPDKTYALFNQDATFRFFFPRDGSNAQLPFAVTSNLFFIKVATGGSIQMMLDEAEAPFANNLDYALWGPYDNLTDPGTKVLDTCVDFVTTATYPYGTRPTGVRSSVQRFNLTPRTGQYYLLFVDNVDKLARTFKMSFTSSNGGVIDAIPNGNTPTISGQPASNAACPGGTLSLNVTATNATGYQWRFNNVNIANATGSTYTKTNFSSANSGRYDVIVSSGSGCYALSNAAVITAGSGTAPTISGQPASANSCVGQSATFAVTASGSSLSYQWRKNGANIPNANSASYTVGSVGNADAGQYDVVVSGSCGSVISSQVGLTVRTPVSITTQPTAQVACPGGSVTFQTAASGDITGYQWRKNSTNIPNATSASLTLSNVGSGNAGQYDVVVSGSCGNVTSSQAGMTVNTPVSIATQPTNQAICSGGSVTFQVTASGDITGYQWRKNGVNIPNANSASLITNGLTNNDSGAYDVVVQGRCGNVTSSQATLTVPSEMQLNISSSAVSCFQGNNGQATVTVSGGASGYSYAWNNGTGTATASDLSAGTYQVTVTDRIGCRKNTSVTVSQPTRLALSMTSAAVKCFGGSDGIATVLASGGAGNYSYRWNSGATTASSGGLNAGTYMVTVTDGNGCVKTASVEVTQPTLMVLNISATAAKCFAGNDGTATVATTGGVGAYSYRWSNGANTATANGLAAGTYTVTVTDGNGCVKTASVEVTQPTLVVLSISSTAAKCFAGNDGTATVTVSGGTGNYSYRWSNRDGGPATTTATANGLTAGTYSVDVTDGNGCVKTASVQVAQPTEVVLTTGSTPVKCFGSNDGTAAVTAAGGTGAYSYRWNTGATTASVSGLIAGTYQVTVTDGNGCAKTVSIEVIQPLVVALSMTSAAVKCFGGSDGIATVLASGGAGNYSYRWNSGATTASSGGLNAGTYMVTVTDGNGCVKTASVEVTQPTLMVLNISATAAKCFAGNDGTATVATTGGVGAYSYRWSNGANTATANGLAAGTYTVTVTDGNGCVKTASVEVTQPTAIELITSSTPANCFGSTDGAAVVAVSGGTGVYSYRWNTRDGGPGATTAAISQLAAGQYQVTVSDASGCQQVGTTTVSQPTVVVLSTSSTAVKCFGGNDGIALVTASGGVGNYTYHWNIGTTTPTTSQLITGAYTVTVTDGNGCVKTTTVQVTQPTRVQFTFQKENVYCFGGSDGKVTLNATGGVGNFQFTVNGTNPTGFASGAQHLLTGLASATYQLALTDGNACPTPAQSVSITQPSQPVSVSLLSFLNPRGFGLTDGSVQVAASGGTLQYTTNWQNTGGTAIGTGQSVSDGKGGIVNTLSQLGDNTYTLTVRDANFNLATQKQGCTATVTQRLVEPAKLTLLLATTQPVACFGRRDARILATADGGVPTDSPLKYTFRWLQQTGGTYTRLNFEGLDIQNLPAGSYRCIVTDKNNITQQADMVITEPTKLLAAASDIKNNGCMTIFVESL